jgi:ribonuclease P protein component
MSWLAAPEGAVISQAAIIIKKTAAPLSTQRTELKRKLRSVILPHLKQSPAIQIVFVYKGQLAATTPQIKTYVDNLYTKLSG